MTPPHAELEAGALAADDPDHAVVVQRPLVPWLMPQDRLMSVAEYEKRIGVERGGILDLLLYG